MIPDLTWQLTAMASVGAGTLLGLAIRVHLSRIDRKRGDR